VNLDDGDDVFHRPFLYMVRAGLANLTDTQIMKLREYLDRGGFLIRRHLGRPRVRRLR
jgi:hypothetical protein